MRQNADSSGLEQFHNRYTPIQSGAIRSSLFSRDFMTTFGSSSPSTLAALKHQGSGRRSRTMLIIGCDYHPSFQQIAFLDMSTGETGERRLGHPAEAEGFYAGLSGGAVRIGMEATGHAHWFERKMRELGHELWIGDR